MLFSFFFFNDTATTEIYTLSLHDALPIYPAGAIRAGHGCGGDGGVPGFGPIVVAYRGRDSTGWRTDGLLTGEKRDGQENVERRETGHGTRAAADEREPLDGASGIRREERARGTGHFPAGREA